MYTCFMLHVYLRREVVTAGLAAVRGRRAAVRVPGVEGAGHLAVEKAGERTVRVRRVVRNAFDDALYAKPHLPGREAQLRRTGRHNTGAEARHGPRGHTAMGGSNAAAAASAAAVGSQASARSASHSGRDVRGGRPGTWQRAAGRSVSFCAGFSVRS